jgi:hypothetical protein
VLGDAYTSAIRAANPEVPDTSDLVMYWWHRAASRLREGELRRFGLITTNSITQPLNRKVVAGAIGGDPPASIVFAIPDHPWISREGAAVRVAMTVVAAGSREGELCHVAREEGEHVELDRSTGRIHADLTLGADVGASSSLRAMRGLAIKGFELGSQGFLIDRETGDRCLRDDPSLARVIRPYVNGDDLMRGRWTRYVIDFDGLTEAEARRYGPLYDQVAERVRADRAGNRDERLLRAFWLFRRSGKKLRAALAGLPRYIATARTASHRVFRFLPAEVMAESKIVVIASGDAYHLGVLGSRAHRLFAERAGGWLGKGNDATYNHVACFEAFPFPACDGAAVDRIRALGEALDAHRAACLEAHPGLTITAMYNALGALRSGAPLGRRAEEIVETGRVRELMQIHDAIDEAVAAAYGFPEGAGDARIVSRLIDLNAERADEERRGVIRAIGAPRKTIVKK